MIIVPDKFIFLCTPRSGSRSTVAALHVLDGTIVSDNHHGTIDEVIEAKKKYGLKTITTLRDPAHILLSYWWGFLRHKPLRITFEDHIKRSPATILWGRIFPYHELTDEYFLFSKGLDAFFKYLGFPDLNVPKIGVRPKAQQRLPDPNYITEEHRALIKEKFPDDVALYEKESVK